MITWNLSEEHAKAIIQLLGGQPTSSGAYPLFLDLANQTDNQLKQEELFNAEENE